MKTLTDDHYVLLGKIAEAAARLEDLWAVVLGDLIDPDLEMTQQITAGMPFDKMVSLSLSITEVKTSATSFHFQRMKEQADKSRAAMRDRNEILHGRWISVEGEDGGRYPAIRSRMRKGGLKVRMFAEVGELAAVATALATAYSELQVVHVEVLEWTGHFEDYAEDGKSGLRRVVPPWRRDGPKLTSLWIQTADPSDED